MSRPVTVKDIVSGVAGWETKFNDNFNLLEGTDPRPIPQFDDIADVLALNPKLFDRCVVLADLDPPNDLWGLVFSDGTEWDLIGVQASFIADSTANNVNQFKTDFNALLAELRLVRQMASS